MRNIVLWANHKEEGNNDIYVNTLYVLDSPTTTILSATQEFSIFFFPLITVIVLATKCARARLNQK